MLKTLIIDNIALIEHIELSFSAGLTVLSGETGSGKSIIVDSLSFVLGDRADKSLIKYGADCAEVSAIFEVEIDSPVLAKLYDYGFGSDNELLISRKMSASGKNEIRINGKPSTLAILREVCSELVDIFGQGQHLALLSEKNQLQTLDSFCNFDGKDIQLKSVLYPKLAEIEKQLKSFGGSDAERERLLDILKFQIDELHAAKLDVDEENELLAMHKRSVNLEKLVSALNIAVDGLDGESGAITGVTEAKNALASIENVENRAVELSYRLDSCRLELDDVLSCLQDLVSETDFSPAEVDKMEARLEQIKVIKRKYGGTIEEANKFLASAEIEYDNLLNSSERIAELNAQKQSVLKQMYALACDKSSERKHTAKVLSDKIVDELSQLGMKGTTFTVEFAADATLEEYANSPSSNGFDNPQFMMSANVGEPLKPLAKVISGGEMSRFLLAVKNITAIAEKIPTMIFDEIDTGISGVIAQKVAEKLARVSSEQNGGYQCIVITHLPQIAAMADNNLYIEKVQTNGKTVTLVTELSAESKQKEVARLMGSMGEHSLLGAKELIEWCDSFKKSK